MSRMFLFLASHLLSVSMEQVNRSAAPARDRKRGSPKLVLEEQLVDSVVCGKLLDAREHLVPRHTDAEHVQRQVVLHMRRDEDLEGVGGAAEGDEAREEVRLEGSMALFKELPDLGTVLAVEFGLDVIPVELPDSLAVMHIDEGAGIDTDQQLDGLGVAVAHERLPQRARAVGAREAQQNRVLLGDSLDRRQRLRGGYSGFQDETVHCLREGRRGRA